jgi:hypothetical protein
MILGWVYSAARVRTKHSSPLFNCDNYSALSSLVSSIFQCLLQTEHTYRWPMICRNLLRLSRPRGSARLCSSCSSGARARCILQLIAYVLLSPRKATTSRAVRGVCPTNSGASAAPRRGARTPVGMRHTALGRASRASDARHRLPPTPRRFCKVPGLQQAREQVTLFHAQLQS